MPTARRSIAPRPAGGLPPTDWEGLYSVYIAGSNCYFRDIAIDSNGDVYACGRFAGTQQLALHKFDADLNPLWQRNFRGAYTSPSNEMWAVVTKGTDVFGFGQTYASSSNVRGSGYSYDANGNFLSREGLSAGFLVSSRYCWVDSSGKFHVVGYRADGGNNYPFYARYNSAFDTLETFRRLSNHNDSFGQACVGGNANELIIAIERRTTGAARLFRWNYLTDTLVAVEQIHNTGNSQRLQLWGLHEYNGSVYAACQDRASRNGPQAATILRYDLDLTLQASKAYYAAGDANFRDVRVDASGLYICGTTFNTSGGADQAAYLVKADPLTLERQAELAFYHPGGAIFYGMEITADAVYAVGMVDIDGVRRAFIVKTNKNLSLPSTTKTCNTDVSLVTTSVSVQAPNLSTQSATDTPSAPSVTEIDPGYVIQSPTLIDDGPCEWNP